MKKQYLVQCPGYWGRGYTLLEAATNCLKAGASRRDKCVVEIYTHPTQDPSPSVVNHGMNVEFVAGTTKERIVDKQTLGRVLCNWAVWDKSGLMEEGGDTTSSLHNAGVLLKENGPIARIDFQANQEKGDYFVTVHWMNRNQFKFTGFAWGYPGFGPRAFNTFLNMVKESEKGKSKELDELNHAAMPIDRFGKTDCTIFINEEPHG